MKSGSPFLSSEISHNRFCLSKPHRGLRTGKPLSADLGVSSPKFSSLWLIASSDGLWTTCDDSRAAASLSIFRSACLPHQSGVRSSPLMGQPSQPPGKWDSKVVHQGGPTRYRSKYPLAVFFHSGSIQER